MTDTATCNLLVHMENSVEIIWDVKWYLHCGNVWIIGYWSIVWLFVCIIYC